MKKQTYYTVGELAKLAGVSRYRILSLLKANHVEPRRAGRHRVVLLYQLRTGFPELWYSLKDRAEP